MEKKLTPIKAIRLKCLQCKENHYKQVENCEDSECPLHMYRMGKNPNVKREYTEEQKQAMRDRLAKARQKNI